MLDFVAANYPATITLESLAREAGISPSHFSRLFKQTLGQSPMRFVTAYRIEEAKKQLGRRETSLGAVAVACGFADHAHFSRAFKQTEGQTPSSYRKAVLG